MSDTDTTDDLAERRALAVETDTRLAALTDEERYLGHRCSRALDLMHQAVGDRLYVRHGRSGWAFSQREVLGFDTSTLPVRAKADYDRARKTYDKASQRLGQVTIEVGEVGAIWQANGRWSRYFLVDNPGGHVHRDTNCSTCYPTTQYIWLVDLADCDEAKMVAEYGELACTVCFPDAPAHKGYADGTSAFARLTAAERDAKAAEKAAMAIELEEVMGS